VLVRVGPAGRRRSTRAGIFPESLVPSSARRLPRAVRCEARICARAATPSPGGDDPACPATGEGLHNPLALSTDVNARRIIAYGLQNPFRINLRPGTNEVWAGDVGWSTWGEINCVVDPGSLENFGWPCYESQPRQLA
jgi:hypothetical protein